MKRNNTFEYRSRLFDSYVSLSVYIEIELSGVDRYIRSNDLSQSTIQHCYDTGTK